MSWIVCCTGSVINDLVAITRAIADVKIVVLISFVVNYCDCNILSSLGYDFREC
jgi:hypothetical protein